MRVVHGRRVSSLPQPVRKSPTLWTVKCVREVEHVDPARICIDEQILELHISSELFNGPLCHRQMKALQVPLPRAHCGREQMVVERGDTIVAILSTANIIPTSSVRLIDIAIVAILKEED